VPVFLRWLLVDVLVIRFLRRRRRRRYADRSYPVQMEQYARSGGRVYSPPAGNYRYVRRRRFSCCAGCLVLIAVMTLGIVLLGVLAHLA
jgi:hypothetical protein